MKSGNIHERRLLSEIDAGRGVEYEGSRRHGGYVDQSREETVMIHQNVLFIFRVLEVLC